MFENRVLRKIFGPKRKEATRKWRRLNIEELYNPYLLTKYLFGCSNKELDGRGMYIYAEDSYTGFWRGNMRKIYHLEDLGVDGRIILKLIFKKCNGGGGHGLD
jgi:hypothetical protein